MRQVARECSCLGETEIARTLGELLDWKRTNGKLKNRECRQLLEQLGWEGWLGLPPGLPPLRPLVGRGWEQHYAWRPLLLETLVDPARFRGTCYRAANWIHIGRTSGRGRMDRENKAQDQAVKNI